MTEGTGKRPQNRAPSGEEKRKEESMRISVQVVAMCFSLNPAPNMYPRIKDTLISLFLF
jgi:hypothetical protein